jgi:prepilin-type N-terminal cleavage/methylation domain-containing protein
MINRINAVVRGTRDRDGGFTMIEVIAAAAITATLAAAVMLVVTGSLRFLASSELVTGSQTKAQYVLSQFAGDAREGLLETATTTTMTFTTRGKGQCDRHTYTLEADASDATRRQLTHTVSSASVPYGASCAVLTTFPINVSNTATTVRVADLDSTSTFRYFDLAGNELSDATMTSLGADLICAIGGAELALDLRVVTQDKTITSTETGFAAMRNTARGLTC